MIRTKPAGQQRRACRCAGEGCGESASALLIVCGQITALQRQCVGCVSGLEKRCIKAALTLLLHFVQGDDWRAAGALFTVGEVALLRLCRPSGRLVVLVQASNRAKRVQKGPLSFCWPLVYAAPCVETEYLQGMRFLHAPSPPGSSVQVRQ